MIFPGRVQFLHVHPVHLRQVLRLGPNLRQVTSTKGASFFKHIEVERDEEDVMPMESVPELSKPRVAAVEPRAVSRR